MVISALDVVIASTDLDFSALQKSSNAKTIRKQDTLIIAALKKVTPKYNKPQPVHGITKDPNDNISHSSSSDDNDEEWTLSHKSFFVGTIQVTAINKVSDQDEDTIVLIDLPITIKVHQKYWQLLHLKADSDAMKNVITKKLYLSLTGDKCFKELGSQNIS